MTSRDFAFWLQGFFEIAATNPSTGLSGTGLSQMQVEVIKRHLALVFIHEIDPSMGNVAHQAVLNDAHEGVPPPTSYPKPRPELPVVRC